MFITQIQNDTLIINYFIELEKKFCLIFTVETDFAQHFHKLFDNVLLDIHYRRSSVRRIGENNFCASSYVQTNMLIHSIMLRVIICCGGVIIN